MDEITKITAMPEDEATRLLRKFGAWPRENQVEAMKLSNDLFFQLRKSHPEIRRAELQLAALILAVSKMQHTRNQVHIKNPDHDLRQIGKTTGIQVDDFLAKRRVKEKKKKPKKKQEKIIALWPEIRLIREHGGSWRAAAEWLAGKHKIKTHWTYIARIARQLEKGGGDADSDN